MHKVEKIPFAIYFQIKLDVSFRLAGYEGGRQKITSAVWLNKAHDISYFSNYFVSYIFGYMSTLAI